MSIKEENEFIIKGKIDIIEPIILKIGEIAKENNFDVYIVGGYVRDYFLSRPRTDFDFTVVGDCYTFAEIVAEKFKTKAIHYKKFRTALVPIGNLKCEFVGTRKEEYLPDSRNPIVSEGTLFDDLKRRDFTINALATKIHSEEMGNVIDMFNGLEDIDKKIIRTPLDPTITFSDDPLRMMRAARFASQLKFTILDELIESAKSISDRIRIISTERIADEFMKILASEKPSVGIETLIKMDLLVYVFPELSRLDGIDTRIVDGIEYHHKDILKHTLKVLDKVAEVSDNIWLRFAALLHDIAKPKTKHFTEGIGWSFHGHEDLGAKWTGGIFKKMKLPFEHIEYVSKLVRLHQRPMVLVNEEVTDSAVRRLAFHAGNELEDLFTLCRADITTNNPKLSEKYLQNYELVKQKVIEVQLKDKLREFQSPVRGEEIMELCNIPPSVAVGIIKQAIEEAILDGIIPNDYDSAKDYFLKNKDIWLDDISHVLRKK
jgi:poly(A) polymerase